MAEVDPRIRQFEQEAAKTLAAMKRSRARAEQFEAETRRSQTSRSDLDERVRREVARDRIRAETIGTTSGAAADRSRSLQEQSRASRDATREQERMTRAQEKARSTEQRLARQQAQTTRTLLSREEALRRYGTYAGGRFMERQAERYYGVPAAAGGGAAGGGGRPPAPPAGGGAAGPPGDGPGGRSAALKEEYRNLKALEAQRISDTRAHQRLIQVQASSSNVLRRHGALTTEFIQAAARGEVTIRELGYQTTATIGKFGGWIAAGAAIYGALGAVQQMGKGALDAYSGVNQLERVVDNVDASSLIGEFSDLADHFQLPFEDVTAGAYEMGKVFHDQNTALQASKALLYSIKVGELDAATAGRYLIAVTNAYNLSASDLNSTFDKFNQLQNEAGVSIAGTESATARAAGAYKAAGGSLDYLIALLGTASRVTGAAPERVGTALQRAPSFIAKPKNQEELRAFGINPEREIDQIFEEAFAIAQKVGGRKRRELAAALFGGAYGAYIGTPLLSNQDVFRRMQGYVRESEGSGARELAKVKASPAEQLKNIGIQFQRLGVGLVESGLVSALAEAVLALDDLFRAANTVVGVFNELPDPLKIALGLMIQMSLLARGLGRLNVGESIAPPGKEVGAGRTFLGAALGGGDRRDARLIRKGLFDEQVALEDERARIADQGREAASRTLLATTRAEAERKRLISLQQGGAADARTIAESQETLRAYEQEANASRADRVKLELDSETKAQRLNQVNESINRSRGRFGRLNVPALLREARTQGGAYPTSFDQPTTARPRTVGAPAYGGVIPGGVPATPIDLSRDLGRQEREMRKADRVARRSNQRLTRLRPLAQRFGNSFNRLIGNMGNLLFAGFLVGLAADELSKQAEAIGDRFDGISEGVRSAAGQAQKLQALRRESTASDAIGEDLADFFSGGFYKDPLGIDYEGVGDARREAARIAASRIELITREQNEAQREGRPVPFRYVSDIQKDIDKLKSADLPSRQSRQLVSRYRDELARSMEAMGQAAGSQKDQQQRLRAARQQLNQRLAETSSGKNLRDVLGALSPEALQERLDAELTQAGSYGGVTKGRIRRIRATYNALQSQFAGARDPESIQALAEARASFMDGVEQVVSEELDHSLVLAKTPEARNAAYTKAFQTLQSSLLGGTRGDIRAQQRKVQNLQQQLRDASARATDGLGAEIRGRGAFGLGSLDFGGSRGQLEKLRQQLRAETGNLKELRQDRKQRKAFLKEVEAEFRRQQYEENAATREARTQLRVSRTANPLAQARIQLQAINAEIPRAIEVYTRNSKEVMDLFAERQEILAQQVQEQVNLIDARGSLRAAGLAGEGNEVERARVELQTLQAKLGFMQANANRFDPAEILQLQAEVREAQIDLAEQVEEEAEQLALAAIDIRIARAEAGGNDVRAARLQLVRARTELGQADTPLERREARANLIGRRAGLRDATAQQAIEDIEFQADIGKLTLDQQISAYKRLLGTMKLTRDMRRDLRRRIHQLREETNNEGAFNLDVGNIRLPTIYEIRRAVQGGVNGGGTTTVNQRQTFNIKSTDPKGAAAEISRISGQSNKAALRSANLR